MPVSDQCWHAWRPDGRVCGHRVDYHARMGVEAFHMHVPVGAHIDALFDDASRQQRIEETTGLNERSPESVGMSRFTPFSHPKVAWQEYYGAPTANYYSGKWTLTVSYSAATAVSSVLPFPCEKVRRVRWLRMLLTFQRRRSSMLASTATAMHTTM